MNILLNWEAANHNKQMLYRRIAQNGHKYTQTSRIYTHTHQTKNKPVPINNDVMEDPHPSKRQRTKNMGSQLRSQSVSYYTGIALNVTSLLTPTRK